MSIIVKDETRDRWIGLFGISLLGQWALEFGGWKELIAMLEISENPKRLEDVKWWIEAKDLENRVGKNCITAESYCPISRSQNMTFNCFTLCHKLWPDLGTYDHALCPCTDGKPVEKVFRGIIEITQVAKKIKDSADAADRLIKPLTFGEIPGSYFEACRFTTATEPKKESIVPEKTYKLGDCFQHPYNGATYAFLRTRNIVALICINNSRRNMIKSTKVVMDTWGIKMGDFVARPEEWTYRGNLAAMLTEREAAKTATVPMNPSIHKTGQIF
jgi:hypothetical protein